MVSQYPLGKDFIYTKSGKSDNLLFFSAEAVLRYSVKAQLGTICMLVSQSLL